MCLQHIFVNQFAKMASGCFFFVGSSWVFLVFCGFFSCGQSRLKHSNHWRHHGTLATFQLDDTRHYLHVAVG